MLLVVSQRLPSGAVTTVRRRPYLPTKWALGVPTFSIAEDKWFGGVCAGIARRWNVDPLIVRALFLLAIAVLNLAIFVNLWRTLRSVRASDLMLGRDEWGANWISAHRARQAAVPS